MWKICSGKSYYSKQLKNSLNAVIISPDEATYELINNEQGEFYNVFSERLNKYLTRKVGEIAKAGANAFAEDMQKVLSVGMNEYIAKPIDMNILVPTMLKYL